MKPVNLLRALLFTTLLCFGLLTSCFYSETDKSVSAPSPDAQKQLEKRKVRDQASGKAEEKKLSTPEVAPASSMMEGFHGAPTEPEPEPEPEKNTNLSDKHDQIKSLAPDSRRQEGTRLDSYSDEAIAQDAEETEYKSDEDDMDRMD